MLQISSNVKNEADILSETFLQIVQEEEIYKPSTMTDII